MDARLAPTVGAALLVAACARSAGPVLPSEPLPGFPTAQAGPDCAPWDGPAVTLIFTAAGTPTDSIRAPYLRVSLWKDLGQLAGHTWEWPRDEQAGAASLCRTQEACEAATTGVVRLERVGADSLITGRLRLGFADQPPLAGRFAAVWRPRAAICG